MSLRVTCQHHFAPSVETVTFKWLPPEGLSILELRLEITDRNGAVVYKKEWSNAVAQPVPTNRQFDWTGENNQLPPVPDSQGAFVKQYVNPLGSPYKARFEASLWPERPPLQRPDSLSANKSSGVQECPLAHDPRPPNTGGPVQDGSAEVRVYYRDLKFVPMTWLEAYKEVSGRPDGGLPPPGPRERRIWLVYKLNELGYCAGPIQDPPDDRQLARALFHFTQTHPELTKFNAFGTHRTLGAGGNGAWGWWPLWEHEFGTLTELCVGPTSASGTDLLRRVEAGERALPDLVETLAALTDRTKTTRILREHNFFYLNGEFGTEDVQVEYDKEFLNRFCWPMRAAVTLVSRDDPAASKDGIDAPLAVGPVECEWILFDPPEDMSKVPPPSHTLEPKWQSRTRAYLEHVRNELALVKGRLRNPWDNCPTTLGGVRPGSDSDMTGYFRALDHAWPSATRGTSVFTVIGHTAPEPDSRRGRTGVFFLGSSIGGDNFIVQARLSVEHAAGAAAIKSEHQKLRGLASAFPAAKDKPLTEFDQVPMIAQSGVLTIWRRHRVAREVIWTEADTAASDWAPVVANFEAAHVVLVPPVDPPIKILDLFNSPTSQADLLAELRRTIAADPIYAGIKGALDARPAEVKLLPGSMLPLPMWTLAQYEAHHAPKAGATDEERLGFYEWHLESFEPWPKVDVLSALALVIRKRFDELQKPPGLLVVRVDYWPRVDYATALPANLFNQVKANRTEYVPKRTIAAGVDLGVVFLDRLGRHRFAAPYFISHEIAHCLFATHPHQIAGDHDPADINCIMYYAVANDGVAPGWAARVAPSRYELKVELKSDEGNLVFDSPAAFTSKQQDEWLCKGTLLELQRALRGIKFEPSNRLRDEPAKIVLSVPASTAPQPVLSVGPIPYTWIESGGRLKRFVTSSIRPFTSLTVLAPDPSVFEPRFCGKCVLKLRGWKVREPAAGAPAATHVPKTSGAIPVHPRMELIELKIVEVRGAYQTADGKPVDYLVGAKDPADQNIRLGPLRFLHVHRLSWESSTGTLGDLSHLVTREHVNFRQPTQDAPFADYADPDQEFAQTGMGSAAKGYNEDDHSVAWPGLITAQLRVPGTLIGEQWYQYSENGVHWTNIEGAAFLLEKTVLQVDGEWILRFKKINWLPHNRLPFSFEIHYRIGPTPRSLPPVVPNPKMGTKARPYVETGSSIRWRSGARHPVYDLKNKKETAVDLKFLKAKGFLFT